MILALDQGTTGTRAVLFDKSGSVISSAYTEFAQIYPHPGWVSHNASEIWASTCQVVDEALAAASNPSITAIGITNQRETAVVWDRVTGEPLHDAIVWQCRRTAAICSRLRDAGLAKSVARKTGLVIDPYFSATKIIWFLENVAGLRDKAEAGDVCFGTIDTWLIYKLTGGASFVTDATNASRTMLYNIHEARWDKDLLSAFDIPDSILPEVRPSSGSFGETTAAGSLPSGIPISGVAGDQQAALFGQRGVTVGDIKNTYGTGCFTLFQTGPNAVPSTNGLLTTISCDPVGAPAFALEGAVFSAGSAVQWLRDGLGILASAPQSEDLARSISDTGGVYLVPAFTGLGAPHWDADARGALLGVTRGTERAHVARAALESIAYQTADLVSAMSADAQSPIASLRVDGGASANSFLMQFQADILDVPVIRPCNTETTAMGAAMLAGLAAGFWSSPDDLADLNPPDRTFSPDMSASTRHALLDGWHAAVSAVLHHAEPTPKDPGSARRQ